MKYLTDDPFYCKDCYETAKAIYVESPETFTCQMCDSENVITDGQRRRELAREHAEFMAEWDERATSTTPTTPTYTEGCLMKRQAS